MTCFGRFPQVLLFVYGLLSSASESHLAFTMSQEVVSEARWDDAGRCGTNALYILLNTVKEIPFETIAKEVKVSSQGSSLAELADASKRLGVGVKCVAVPKNQLKSFPPPFLMHIDLVEQGGVGHFVTVIQTLDNAGSLILRIVDGGDAKTKLLDLSQFKGSYSGFLIVLEETSGILHPVVMLMISFGLGILSVSWLSSTFNG